MTNPDGHLEDLLDGTGLGFNETAILHNFSHFLSFQNISRAVYDCAEALEDFQEGGLSVAASPPRSDLSSLARVQQVS